MTHPPKQPDAAPVAPWPVLLTAPMVGRYLSINARTVWRMSATGEIPRPVRLGGKTLWKRVELDRAIEELTAKK